MKNLEELNDLLDMMYEAQNKAEELSQQLRDLYFEVDENIVNSLEEAEIDTDDLTRALHAFDDAESLTDDLWGALEDSIADVTEVTDEL
jgi:hypothetical protein